jgi:hypothetical protein
MSVYSVQSTFVGLQSTIISAQTTFIGVQSTLARTYGWFLSGGIILGSPLSSPDLFLYTITLSAVGRDATAILSYSTGEATTGEASSQQQLTDTQQHSAITTGPKATRLVGLYQECVENTG